MIKIIKKYLKELYLLQVFKNTNDKHMIFFFYIMNARVNLFRKTADCHVLTYLLIFKPQNRFDKFGTVT